MGSSALSHTYKKIYRTPIHQNITESNWQHGWKQLHSPTKDIQNIREFGIRKGLKKLVISSKIRIFIGENQ